MKIYEEVIPEKTGQLLEILNGQIKEYGFYLAGGTGLSLQIGHRISEDLDFFSPIHFKTDVLSHYLFSYFNYQETAVSSETLYCNINNVKISFIYYKVPLVYPKLKYKKIEIASWKDILAEKFKTLSQRGSRKDFYDIYFTLLLKKISISESIKILKNRFKGTNINYYHILKSLVYFKETEKEPDPILLKNVSWEEVKAFFIKNLTTFEKYLLEEEK